MMRPARHAGTGTPSRRARSRLPLSLGERGETSPPSKELPSPPGRGAGGEGTRREGQGKRPAFLPSPLGRGVGGEGTRGEGLGERAPRREGRGERAPSPPGEKQGRKSSGPESQAPGQEFRGSGFSRDSPLNFSGCRRHQNPLPLCVVQKHQASSSSSSSSASSATLKQHIDSKFFSFRIFPAWLFATAPAAIFGYPCPFP